MPRILLAGNRDVVHELIPSKEGKVLMLGCGNSTMGFDMAQDGYQNIVNLDFSNVLIEQMKNKYPQSELSWHVMDVRALAEHADTPILGGAGTYDAIVDKGTLDALTAETNGSVWDPSEEVRDNVRREVEGVLQYVLVLVPLTFFVFDRLSPTAFCMLCHVVTEILTLFKTLFTLPSVFSNQVENSST